MANNVTTTFRGTEIEELLVVAEGSNLRQVLIENGISPYTNITRILNCGGRGLCATCGVWISLADAPPADHWHDRLAQRFGYPRLACQVTVDRDLTIFAVNKWIWGNQSTREKDMQAGS